MWTAGKILELERLWESDIPTSVIGSKLGVTKNAVIGKAHRLSLVPRRITVRKSAIINEAMVRAGEQVLLGELGGAVSSFWSAPDLAVRVYRAMISASVKRA